MMKKNISKPVRVVPPMLEEQTESKQTFGDLLRNEETISHLLFDREQEEEIKCCYKSIQGCVFRNKLFSGCTLESSQLTDIRFENCDLSNMSFAKSTLYRVEFISCKLLGTNFGEATLNHIHMHNCTSPYINLSMTKMNQIHLSHSDFRNGSFNDSRLSSVKFEHCDLVEADFSHTSLRGIDLCTSRINSIILNITDLKGAIVTSLQAMDLLPLLGVVIQD